MNDKNNADVAQAFEAKVSETVGKYKMFEGALHPSVLVGLSGGADSTALLLSLLALSREEFPLEVSCAHVNHMIRGSEADRDEDFARALCKKLCVRFFSVKINVPKLAAESKKGIEEAARDARYEYFSHICAESGIDFIATAHTASDNAETVLFNLVRGSGLDGLCGIPPKRGNIIRPLIRCTRAEVEEYLSAQSQNYVTDSTNLCADYSRNLLRLEVIPKLKRINPSVEKTLFESCESLRNDRAFICEETEKLASNGLCGAVIAKASVSLASRAVRDAYRDFCGGELSSANLAEILRVAKFCGDSEKYVSVADGCFAAISNKGFRFTDGKKAKQPLKYDYFLKSGENIIYDTEYLVLCGKDYSNGFQTVITHSEEISYKMILNYSLFSDRIKGNIGVRSKKDGDAYIYGGMTRRLKRVFIDKKIPENERSRIPVIYDENGIIFTAVTPLADAHRGDGGDYPIAIYKLS